MVVFNETQTYTHFFWLKRMHLIVTMAVYNSKFRNFSVGNATQRKRMYEDKISAWAAGRAELIHLQRQAFVERQQLEIELRKNECEKKLKLELEILKLKKEEQEKQIESNQAKAKLELEILKLRREECISRRSSHFK